MKRPFELGRTRARFLCAIVAAGCGGNAPAAREPAAVSVKPPPTDDDENEDEAALPERGGPSEADGKQVWKTDSHVCVNESGTDAESGAGFGGCHAQPKRELVSESEIDDCGYCVFRIDEQQSNAERAAGRRSACCYRQIPLPVPGRPLRDGARVLIAPERDDPAWRSELAVETSSLAPELRAELARAWTDDALLEHASVGSFAQLSLDLLALGAPPELLCRASRAALDEIEHARLCFSLASAYAGRDVGPGALPLPASRTLQAEALAEEIFRDGCVGETRAAVEARMAAKSARDPAVRRALERIARDEEDHAELAWMALVWLVARAPGTRTALERSVVELRAKLAYEPAVSGPDLGEHGRLCERTRRELSRATLAQVIEPCVRTLFDRDLQRIPGGSQRLLVAAEYRARRR